MGFNPTSSFHLFDNILPDFRVNSKFYRNEKINTKKKTAAS